MLKPEVDTFIIDSIEELRQFRDHFNESNPTLITLDTETNSVSEKTALLYGVGISINDNEAFYIVTRRKDGSEVFGATTLSAFFRWLLHNAQGRKLCMHNGIYDILVLENNVGVSFQEALTDDSILMKHLVDEERPFGLKEVAVKYLGEWADKAQADLYENIKANGGTTTKDNLQMFLADSNVLGEYCCWDVLLTRMLFQLFDERIDGEGLRTLYEEEVMTLYREVTIGMKRKGFHVDVEYFKKLHEEVTVDIAKLEDTIQEEIQEYVYEYAVALLDKDYGVKKTGLFPKILAEKMGVALPVGKTGSITLAHKSLLVALETPATPQATTFYSWLALDAPIEDELLNGAQFEWFQRDSGRCHVFNLKSNFHLGWLFFEKLGEEPLSETEGGKPQCDDDFLDSVIKKYPFVAKLVDYKKLIKLQTTYIEGILDREIDGVIYTSFLQFGTTSGRYSSTNPNCLSMDTEVLTRDGFKFYEGLRLEDEVACYNESLGEIEWHAPETKWKSERQTRTMVSARNGHIDMLVTENHRCLFKDRKTGLTSVTAAAGFLRDARFLHGASLTTRTHMFSDMNWIRFLIAVQADAEIRMDSSRITFRFTKKRKFERLMEILSAAKLRHEWSICESGQYKILVDDVKQEIINTLGEEKTFPSSWLGMGLSEREIFLEEIWWWDGLSTRKNNYSSNNELNADFLQGLMALHGWRAHKRFYYSGANAAKNFQLDVTRRNWSGSANAEVSSHQENCEVWCLKVPTSFFVVRRGSDTLITGNCQNLPRPKGEDSNLSALVTKYSNAIRGGFVAPVGYKIVDADYSALEPRAFAHMSDDKNLQAIFHSGEDMYSAIAKRVFKLEGVSTFKKDPNFLGTLFPEKRQAIKTMALAVTYGAEAGRIADLLRVSKEEAQQMIDDYMSAYPGLKTYIKSCHESAKKNGFVTTIFGRKRHLGFVQRLYNIHGDKLLDFRYVRAKKLGKERSMYKTGLNNSTNMPIQGLAAHTMNRASIMIARALKEEKLDAHIALQIHDQLIVVSKEEAASRVKDIVKECMESSVDLSVPLVTEPAIALNLRDSH